MGELDATVPDDAAAVARASVRTIGRYQLERELGAGGMGVVYAAFDSELERRVAVKVLREDSRWGSEERLLREARAMARLTHPNVVTVYDVGTDDGRDYIAMELVEGGSLVEWLRGAGPTRRDVVAAFLAAGRGLAAAHDAGIVHRDFKPHNVLRSRHGRIAVSDFGVAREASDAPMQPAWLSTLGGLTVPGSLLGTPAYMAPEQWTSGEVTAATDQFAFCVALWEALAGRRPYHGDSVEELREQVLRGPDQVDASAIPPRLRGVLRRGLAVDPARRWPSMPTLLEHLERYLHRRRTAVVVVTLGIFAAAAVFGGGALRLHDNNTAPGAECPSAETALASVWSPIVRGQWQARLPPQVAATFGDNLDRWATAWKQQFDASCVRTGDPDRAARRLCLEAQRDELRSWLRHADDRFLRSLAEVDIARSLPAVESCVRAPRAIAPPLPPDAGTQARIAEIRALLVSIVAEARLAPSPNALADITKLVEQARALGYNPVLADAQHARAVLLQVTAPSSNAEHRDALEAAYAQFAAVVELAEVDGYDRVRAQALLGQIETGRELANHADELESLVQQADRVLTRLGDPPERPALDALRARMAFDRHRLSQAIEFVARARAGWIARHAPIGTANMTYAEAMLRELRHDGDDLERAAALLHELERDERTARESDVLALAARVEWRTGRRDGARALFERAGAPVPADDAGDPYGGVIEGMVRGVASTRTDSPETRAWFTRRTLPHLIVANEHRRWMVLADGGGAFRLTGVPPGTYEVTAAVRSLVPGVQLVRAHASVVSNGTTTVDLAFRADTATHTDGTYQVLVALPAGSLPRSPPEVVSRWRAGRWAYLAEGEDDTPPVLAGADTPFVLCKLRDAHIADEFSGLELAPTATAQCALER